MARFSDFKRKEDEIKKADRDGEEKTLEEEICELYNSSMVRKYITAKFPIFTKEEAEDIESDVFAYVLKNIDNLRDRTRLKCWIYKIAKSFALMAKKRKCAERIVLYGDDFSDVVDRVAGGINNVREAEQIGAIRALTADLIMIFPPVCATIMRMRYKEDLTIKEIAARMDMNYSSVRSIHSRCIKLLKNLMAERGVKLNNFYD